MVCWGHQAVDRERHHRLSHNRQHIAQCMCLALPQFVDASAGHEHIHPRSSIGRNSNGTYLFLLAVRNFPALPLESISIGSKG